MVATDDMGGGCERIGLPKHRIGSSNRQSANGCRMHYVTEVEYTDNLPGFCAAIVDQHIIVVAIIVNNTCPQQGQPGCNLLLELEKKTLDDPMPCWLLNILQVVANPIGILQVPLQYAMRGGMSEVGQRTIQRTNRKAQAMKQCRCVGIS